MAAETSYCMPELRAVDEKSYHRLEVRGGGREEQPHVQGAAATQALEGQEELLHI